MIKRTLALTILISMVLHCACRLGFISYLYENRHQIASSIGLVVEIQIASCSSDYDADESLHVKHTESDKNAPLNFRLAHEINLFVQHHVAFSGELNGTMATSSVCPYSTSHYLSPHLDIFQPPRI